jgi:hypothetical protein
MSDKKYVLPSQRPGYVAPPQRSAGAVGAPLGATVFSAGSNERPFMRPSERNAARDQGGNKGGWDRDRGRGRGRGQSSGSHDKQVGGGGRGRGEATEDFWGGRQASSTKTRERCCICNHDNDHSHHCRLHDCPVDSAVLGRLSRVVLSDTVGDDCFADWYQTPQPSKKAYAKLWVKKDPNPELGYSYVLIGDNKKVWVGSEKFTPGPCNKYLQIHLSDLSRPDEDLSIGAIDRVARSVVYGNSLVASGRRDEVYIRRTAALLVEETLLLSKLLLHSPSLREGAVNVRLAKGLVDKHDMDTASMVILGDVGSLDTLIQAFERDAVKANDSAATALVHVDTKQFCLSRRVQQLAIAEIATIMVTLGIPADKKMEMNSHLMHALKAMTEGTMKDILLPDRLLLMVCNFNDVCSIGIPGGMRSLGESPLECAIRKNKAETGISFTDSNLKFLGDPRVDVAEVGWELFIHNQVEVNQYFVRPAMSLPVVDGASGLASQLETLKV